jgi:hypothetical protein
MGMPPELTEGQDKRTLLPLPHILLLEEEPQATYLYRFTEDGTFCGDTWHETLDDAFAQAVYEYGDALGAWHTVPPEIPNVLEYAQTIRL